MDREPAGVDDAGWRAPGRAPAPQRRVVAWLAAGMVLLLVIAVLATCLASVPGPQSAAATATPAPTATATAPLTVPTIYQRAAPSVVPIRAGDDLGTGVIVADDGTILTADHVVAGGGSITVTFADGTVANASVPRRTRRRTSPSSAR